MSIGLDEYHGPILGRAEMLTRGGHVRRSPPVAGDVGRSRLPLLIGSPRSSSCGSASFTFAWMAGSPVGRPVAVGRGHT